jgi:hypothetical protein
MTLIISKGLTLDNGTRAAAIAGVSPTLDYRFAREKREIETVSLTDKLTYTGGNGTFVGSDGFIQRATTNIPRFDHDPLSRQSLGLLSEASRENLLLRSEEFNQSGNWASLEGLNGFGSGSVANAETSPNGQVSADLITESTSTGFHRIGQAFSYAANTIYMASVYAKAGLQSRLHLQLSTGLFKLALFNLETGTATGDGKIQPVGNGWYRCSLFSSNTVSGSATIWVEIANNSNQRQYTGDGTSGIYLWGAQLEAASIPSTYIPTTSAAVTRTADSAVIDGTGVVTGTYTLVEKPAGCAVVSGTNINLQPGFTAERVMVFPAALDAGQITAIRGAM